MKLPRIFLEPLDQPPYKESNTMQNFEIKLVQTEKPDSSSKVNIE